MEATSQTFAKKATTGGPRRIRRALLLAACILLPASPSFAQPPRNQNQIPPRQLPSPEPTRPTLRVRVTAKPNTLDLCPRQARRVRLSVDVLPRLPALAGAAGYVNYAWGKPTAGKISGEGAEVSWDLSGVGPGVYAADVVVSFSAPSGPTASGRASARVTLRKCKPDPPPTPDEGQVTAPVGNTSPVPPVTPSLTPTPTPTPATGPGGSEQEEWVGGAVRLFSWRTPIIPALLVAAFALAALWQYRSKRYSRVEKPEPEVVAQEQDEAGLTVGGVTEEEEVRCSVFAPFKVAPGDGFLVQAFAHLAEQAAQLPALAREAEPRAERRGAKELGRVARGQALTFQLQAPGLEVDEPSQAIVWRGRVESAQFGVNVPEAFTPRTVNCKLTVAHPNLLGHIRFTVEVAAAAPPDDERDRLRLFDNLVRYRQAFISYASEDRAEVLKRVQVLKAMRIKFFQDVISLEPGERWRRQLYRNIDLSDVFLLFWSAAARRSEWVEKEVRYALARKGSGEENPPEIVPVILQGPPEVPPPSYLPEYHFNDPFAYFIKAEEAPRRTAGEA